MTLLSLENNSINLGQGAPVCVPPRQALAGLWLLTAASQAHAPCIFKTDRGLCVNASHALCLMRSLTNDP